MKSRSVPHDGEEVFTAEGLTWDRMEPALPPPAFGGKIAAASVCDPAVAALLLYPGKLLKPEAIWKDRRNKCSSVVRGCRVGHTCTCVGGSGGPGRDPLGRHFQSQRQAGSKRYVRGCNRGERQGFRAPSFGDASSPGNYFFVVIEGDMKTLPNWEAWSAIVMDEGEVLLWNSEDLKYCFYVCPLPAAWRPYITFSKPVRSELLGRPAGSLVWLASAVVPMGWTSATGCVQHIYRRLVMAPPPAGAGICKWDEIRCDAAFPSQASSVTRVEGALLRKLWQVYPDSLDVWEIWDFADLAAVLAKCGSIGDNAAGSDYLCLPRYPSQRRQGRSATNGSQGVRQPHPGGGWLDSASGRLRVESPSTNAPHPLNSVWPSRIDPDSGREVGESDALSTLDFMHLLGLMETTCRARASQTPPYPGRAIRTADSTVLAATDGYLPQDAGCLSGHSVGRQPERRGSLTLNGSDVFR